ncbi:MAG: hypothetical protein ACYTHJ_17525 [Planctomycetota bacterium]|jgi:hypothetical protein
MKQTMKSRRPRRLGMTLLFSGGCLLAGPCGITSLQFQDFVTSTLIRTGVTTLASLVEAATIQNQE